jgi:AcrR family transcriptional regulator
MARAHVISGETTGGDGPAPLPEGNESFEQRLSHILAAATDLISRDGYEKASMRNVAAAAGVSLAGIYHYFDSKERMLFLIQFRSFSALLNSLREKVFGLADPVEQLRTMVRNHVDYFVANMPALKACSHELDSLSGPAYREILEIRRDYYTLTRSIIDRILDAHAPSSALDRHVATMSLFGTLNWLYRWYNPQRDRSPAALASQIVDQFLHGVLGTTASSVRRGTGSAAAAPG